MAKSHTFAVTGPIAAARQDVANANLETARIKDRIAWREPTQQQIRAITDSLAGAHLKIIPWYLSTDPEATNLYLILKDAFTAAGVEISPDDEHQLFNPGTPRYGVLLGGREQELRLMERALQAGGVEVTYAGVSDETLTVWVVTKPRKK